MKKKWIFAALVAIIALAMVGCDNGGGTGPGPEPEGPKVTITFISFPNDTPIEVKLPKGASFDSADEELPKANQYPGEWAFAFWEDAFNAEVTGTRVFDDDETVTGKWWSTTLVDETTDPALEKVYLENGSYVLYEFDLAGKSIADITKIEVSYKLNEASTHKGVRNLRLMGPYIYRDFISNIDAKVVEGKKVVYPHYGDFAIDENGAYGTRFIASATAADYNRDKNGPYINNNIGAGDGANWASDIHAALGAAVTVEVNKWFTLEYPFRNNFFTGTTVENINKTAFVKVAQDGDKVYFGVGITTNDGGTVDDNSGGILQLIKDVKMTVGSDTVTGTIPSFPDLKKGGANKTSQVFATYFDPNQYNWRGKPADPLARPTNPAAADAFAVDLGDYDPFGAYDTTSGEGHFFLNLNDWQNLSSVGSGIDRTLVTLNAGGKIQGPLDVTFAASIWRQRLIIGLLPDQIAIMRKALGTVTITIDGESDDNTTEFRASFADKESGSGWQGTAFITKVASALFDEHADIAFHSDFTGGKPQNVDYFAIQATGTPAAAVNLKINSIKIDYVVLPPVACNCPSMGACIPFVGTGHVCNGGGTASSGAPIVCSCNYDSYGTAAVVTSGKFTAYPGIKQAGTARFTVLKDGLSTKGLLISHRANDYSTIDLDINGDAPGVSLSPGTTYTITVTGKAIVTDPKSEVQLYTTGNPATFFQSEDVTGTEGAAVDFTITTDQTGSDLATGGLRIRVYPGTPAFIIKTVKLQAGSAAALIDVTF